jgi:hypothetical protein
MKHLKKYNETVWTSGKITGSRSQWSQIVLDTLEDVGIVIDRKEWHEPPTKPYSMSYEMGKSRLSLDVKCGEGDVLLGDVLDYLGSFMDQLKGDNIGVLATTIHFKGILDEDNPDDRTPLRHSLFIADEKTEKSLMNAHKNGIVTRISFVVKKFDDISEYNMDYIKKYQSYFK